MTPLSADQREWLEAVRLELSAPLQSLRDQAEWFRNDATHPKLHAQVQRDADRIHMDAEELGAFIDRLLAGQGIGHDVADGAGFESFVRHEMRGFAGRVVGRCECIMEESGDDDLPESFEASLKEMLRQSAGMVACIDAIVRMDPKAGSAAVDPQLDKIDLTVPAYEFKTLPGRILVVDDKESNRELLERRLRRNGHQVVQADGGEAALAILRTDPAIDLILLDLLMPGMNGYHVLSELKRDPSLSAFPVIMITSLDTLDSAVTCLELGADEYLLKTCEPVVLQTRVCALLEKKRLRDREMELIQAIFPGPLVAEYRESRTIKTRRHDRVGVLFLDVAGFTDFSERHEAEYVLELLEKQITEFEEITIKHGAHKIKTIGDAFMAAANLLSPCATPVRNLLNCGLEMIEAAPRIMGMQIRVGIHVGPLVAGKLGRTQFTYDIFGSTVNVAARMESNGKPGRVTLSPDAWAEVQEIAEATPRDVAIRGVGPMQIWDFVRFK